MGIDLGTSGIKALLLREDGICCGSGYSSYSISIPKPGYAEQNPKVWWNGLKSALSSALKTGNVPSSDIKGIGLSGQMHGTLLLEKSGKPLYPAIIWCDQRSAQQVQEIYDKLGKEKLGEYAQNPIAVGFQAASVLWMKENEPEIYSQAHHILLPKDYIRFLLTGEYGTEPTDACSTLLFDCAKRCWSVELLKVLDIDQQLLPKVFSSPTDTAGTLSPWAAQELGLSAGIPVVFGGGDQPMQAVGNGILYPGDISITLGTGGQILAPLSSPKYDKELRTHLFCHVLQNTWYLMGATLNCCLAQNWFLEKVLGTNDFSGMHSAAAKIEPGSGGLYFVPYISGERTPYMDPNARGIFLGLTLAHDRASMMKAVIEGICYSIKDAFACLKPMLPDINSAVLSGGGARSKLWRQTIADMLGIPIKISCMNEEAGTGAAICAMVGTGAFSNLSEAASALVSYSDTLVVPNPTAVDFYNQHFITYQEIYKANKNLFGK